MRARRRPKLPPGRFTDSDVAPERGVASSVALSPHATRKHIDQPSPTLSAGFFLMIRSPTFAQPRCRGSSRAHLDQPAKVPLEGFPTGIHRPTLRNPLCRLLHGKLSTIFEKSRWRNSSQEHVEEPFKFLSSRRATRKRSIYLHLRFRMLRTAMSRPRMESRCP